MAYAKKILEKAGLGDCNPVKYPMNPKESIGRDEGGQPIDTTQFKSLVGGLRYQVHTRPDITFSMGIISRFMEKPTSVLLNAAKRILRYIRGTINFGLVYTKNSGNNVVTGYSDSDLAGQIEDPKSTGGMVFYLNASLITWVSQKQRCVALSSYEAEFMAATAVACQAIWLRKLLTLITGESMGPVVLYIDNKSAIDLAKSPVFHGRSKHIDIHYHFIRECVKKGEIIVKHVSIDKQQADILTKAFPVIKFEKMR
ncbi:secreted RxLR effector protein 161-like [Apium graveolens]|uniref:secreted RxLR effector protein 161-like n=1 Tax=Apium graveolens TaxID=4045 RepID=UPI003D7A530E